MQLFKHHLGRCFHVSKRKDLFMQIKINFICGNQIQYVRWEQSTPGFWSLTVKQWNTKNILHVLLVRWHRHRIWSSHVTCGTETTWVKMTIALNHRAARKMYCNLSKPFQTIAKWIPNVPNGMKRASFPCGLPERKNRSKMLLGRQ